MKKFQSLESFFMGVMGFALFLFVGLSFAFIAPRRVQTVRPVAGEVACAPAAAARAPQAAAQRSGGEQAESAAAANRNAS